MNLTPKMNRTTLITTLLTAGLFGHQATAAIIATESFSGYADPAADITGQNPANAGFSGAWGGENNPPVVNPDLTMTHPLLPQAASGGRLESNNDGGNGRGVVRTLADSTLGSVDDIYYYSLVFSRTKNTYADVGLFMGLSDANDFGGVLVGLGSSGVGSDNNVPALSVGDIQTDFLDDFSNPIAIANDGSEEWFALVTIENFSSGLDNVEASIYAPGVTDVFSPTSTITQNGVEVSNELTNLIYRRSFRGGSNFDEFRLGTELSDVAAIPEPSKSAFLLVGMAALVLTERRRRA